MSVIADRMAKRIKSELGIEVIPEIKRSYAGHIERSAGAVSWTMTEVRSSVFKVGSQWSATEMLKSKKWEYRQEGNYLLLYPVFEGKVQND